MGTTRYSRILTFVFGAIAFWFPLNAQQTDASPEIPPVSTPATAPEMHGIDAAADKPAPTKAVLPFGAPVSPLRPVIAKPVQKQSPGTETGVRWRDLSVASSRFLMIEHGFRLLTEPGTRSGLKGSYIRSYGRSVANLHGWADGDEFYVNYVGHPMQGSVAGYLWVHNDPAYRSAVFGTDRRYWKGRLRAAAFMWLYSTQFEIGPISEASIGAIQSRFPQQGFVDHVITPSIGMAWMIGEDTIDRYLIEPLEARTGNRWVRLLVRSSLNPSRTFANLMTGRTPWARDTRVGVNSYERPVDPGFGTAIPRKTSQAPGETPDNGPAPPFEFALTFQPERIWGRANSVLCLGGAGTAAFRLARAWQLVAEVGGCKTTGLGKDLSGDSLTYAAGPRWLGRIGGGWTAQLQVLFGGNKVTQERMYPGKKSALEALALRDNKPPPTHGDYTDETESNGMAISTGGGVSYQVNNALSIRVADLSYRHSWTNPLWGRDYSNSVKFSSGVVIRMGTW